MSPKEAYEEDVRLRPTYHDGARRKTWDQLGAIERWTWERNPIPRRILTAAALLLSLAAPSFAAPAPCVVNVATCSPITCAYLPGVGQVIGGLISHAHPKTEAELDAVKGIGPKKLETLRPFVVYQGETTCTSKQTAPKSTDGAL